MAANAHPFSNCCMHETFRMLGAEHQADLERHAAKWNRATKLLNDPQHATQIQQPARTKRIGKRALLSVFVARLRMFFRTLGDIPEH